MTPVVELRAVAKSFGPVRVIEDVSLAVDAGTVHALLGENGAGKSTLIKMIAGVHRPDAGEVLIDGSPVTLDSTAQAEALGIATIYQELTMVPALSVAENIMLGRLPRRAGLVDWKATRARAREALDFIGLDVDLDQPVGTLGIAHQQLVEIAKALSQEARILILDEPTASLSRRETQQFFRIIDTLKERGVAMIFISHHLEEITEIADTVSVLRDGVLVATVSPTTSHDELVRLMVGRDITETYPRERGELGAPVLEVENLKGEGFDAATLTVRAGEVVGIAGLVGAGRTELLRAIAGADVAASGSVRVNGTRVRNGDIAGAISAGLAIVPEDRKGQGLILDASVAANMGLATLHATSRGGLVDRRGQRERSQHVAEQLRIRMRDIDQPVRDLSGGNQQKAVFGRWAQRGSTVLLLDEPTRGVDVGARVEIYSIINSITAAGGGVLMVSSDLPEVLGMADRILVMAGGRLVGELPPTATQDEVMNLAVAQAAAPLAEQGDENV